MLVCGTSCGHKQSQIIGGKICPFCLYDNPIWRKDYCPACYKIDSQVFAYQ